MFSWQEQYTMIRGAGATGAAGTADPLLCPLLTGAANRCWSSLVTLNCRLPGYYILFVHIISYFH